MMKLMLPLLSYLPYDAAYAISSSASSQHRSLSVAQLSDDFTDATTLSDWDGIASNRIESVDIINGELNLVPTTGQTFGYYGNGQGLALTKTIEPSTDFVIETSVTVTDADMDWCSAGLIVQRNNGNYMQVNLGRQGPAFGALQRTYGTQAMNTNNGGTTFDYLSSSPVDNSLLTGRLRICSVGNDVALLRNADGVDGGWTVLSTTINGDPGVVSRPDFSSSALNVGVVMNRYSNASPTFGSAFDYVAFATPSVLSDCEVDDLASLGSDDVTPSPTGVPSDHPTAAPIPSPTPPPVATPEPTTAQPTPPPTAEPTTAEPTTSAPTTAQPTTAEPTTAQPTTSSPTTNQPSSVTSPPVFDVTSLSDEFTCSQETCTVQDNGWTEQYPDRYQNVPVISDGNLVISPGQSFPDNVWFEERHGSMISKLLPAGNDFVVETRVNTRLVGDPTAVPTGNWNVGGLVMRSTVDLDDWVVLNIGLQGPHDFGANSMGLGQTLGVEAKSTTNAQSIFNYEVAPDFPNTTGDTMTARLRICRVGSTIRFLYQFVDTTAWSSIHALNAPNNLFQENDLERTDLLGDLEVGMMTNSMYGSNQFEATFDYIRFGALGNMDDCGSFEFDPLTGSPSSSPVTAEPTTAAPTTAALTPSPSTTSPTNPPPFFTTADYNPDGTVSVEAPTGTTYTCTADV